MAIAIGAGIAAVGGLAASSMNSSAASDAAGAQQQSDAAAIAEQQREFNIQQQNEAPYLASGQQGLNQLNAQLPSLTAAFNPSDLQNYPGYQFQLQQGALATQDQNASRGLLNSGATLKDLTNYNQNLASTTYNQAFNQYQTQQTNTFNKLAAVAGIGQAATQQANSAAQNAGNNISSALIGSGNAQAGGIVGSNNALTQGLTGAAGTLGQYATLQGLMNNGQASNNASYGNPSADFGQYNTGSLSSGSYLLGG